MSQPADPFADALESFWRSGKGSYRCTREDGWSQVEDASWYFTNYRDFPSYEKAALRFVQGRVLDLGCGAGRHSLYLQRRGFEVIALDVSTRVAEIARVRGVRKVIAASACDTLPFGSGYFDTVLMLGNNLGICGDRRQTVRACREFARITRPNARIIATTRAPGLTDKKGLSFWRRELAKGKDFGVLRLRLDCRKRHRRWVSLFLVSPIDLLTIAEESGFVVTHLFGAERAEEGYAAVVEKTN